MLQAGLRGCLLVEARAWTLHATAHKCSGALGAVWFGVVNGHRNMLLRGGLVNGNNLAAVAGACVYSCLRSMCPGVVDGTSLVGVGLWLGGWCRGGRYDNFLYVVCCRGSWLCARPKKPVNATTRTSGGCRCIPQDCARYGIVALTVYLDCGFAAHVRCVLQIPYSLYV
jgi:hypothetical protein